MRALVIALMISLGLAAGGAAQAQEIVRIAAVVNDDVISMHDFLARLRMVMVMSRLPNTAEVRNRLASEVLRTLIDEKLKLQEAERLGLSVSDEEMDNARTMLEQRNNMQPGQFKAYLASQGIQAGTVEDQVRSALAWNKVIQQRVRPSVRVTEDEVLESRERLRENLDEPSYLVSEIFITVDSPDSEDSVRALADRLIEQVGQGADFANLARQFSHSATAATGGDMGWIQEGDADREFMQAIKSMRPGQVLGPIRTLAGYHIILLRDRRIVASPKPENVVVSLAQVLLPYPESAGADEIESQRKLARTVSETATDCADMTKVGQELGSAAGTKVEGVKVSDLAADLRPAAMTLEVGKASEPVDMKNGVAVIMICDRSGDDVLPSSQEIRARMVTQRLELLTRRYLRDLRRSAFLDVRV